MPGGPPLVSRPTDFTDPDALSFEYAVDKPVEARLRRLVSDKGRGLSTAELLAKFKALGHAVDMPEDAAELMRLIDLSGDGQIELSELVEALRDQQAAKTSFARMDRKKRGYVSVATVSNDMWCSSQPAVYAVARATAPTLEQLALLVETYDDNGNGFIDEAEFVAMFADFRHGRMSAARERSEEARTRISRSIHAWSELEWLADELGLGAKTAPHAPSAPAWTKFAVAGLGGASGWLVVHPLDVAKTRAQLAEKGSGGLLATLGRIYRADGLKGFAAGLSAALTRQLTYTTARIGLYDVFRDSAQRMLPGGESGANGAAGFVLKLGCGLSAGGIAAVLSCPIEVALVRMQADSLLPPDQRRGYRHVGHALVSIFRAEGVAAGWRGVGATVGRGMLVSMAQLTTYDQAKGMLKAQLRFKEGVQLHLSAAICSGFAYSAISLPVDSAKTRLQHQRPRPDGTLPFRSMWHAMSHTARTEGVSALWRGFPAYFARGGGHTVCMFLCVEQYRRAFDRLYGVNPT
ncbi:hypothetical protein KFE25_003259 [Diacronema lutheri]|uniref:EF-hand domain-containing protein n=2 Tax=Diacronema lutheri TaxID=2081491 RepID=A0A8J6CAL0_DIALT|nr:hypothetical protein KFE25_003259 [Diacronema lutheri]